MADEFDPQLNPSGIGHQLGYEGVEHVVSTVEGYCECERQRIELSNAPRILALRAEMAALMERVQELKEQLLDAPKGVPPQRSEHKTAYYWFVAALLTVAGFIFSVIVFEPFGLGWKSYVYCLGIAVVTPFCVDKLLETWASERLIKSVITICFVSALASLVLLAIIRGDLLMHQLQDVVPAVTFDDGTQGSALPENNFYKDTLPLLRLVMAFLAVAMELGAGLAFHDAQRLSNEAKADSQTDYEVLRNELKVVRGQMVARLYEIDSCQREAPIFVARFWRDFYRAMLVHTVRSALYKLVLFALLAVPFASSQAFAQERLELVIALDLTESTNHKAPDGRTGFKKNVDAITQLLARIPSGSHVTVLGITNNSFAQPYVLLSANVSPDEGYFKERLASARRAMAQAWTARSASLKPAFRQTDVFGAALLAGQVFEKSPANTKKVLVILSDMVHETKSLTLKKSTEAYRREQLARLKASGMTTNLKNVDIHVLGSEVHDIQPFEWHRLQEFWKEYFRVSEANLIQYSVLRRFLLVGARVQPRRSTGLGSALRSAPQLHD